MRQVSSPSRSNNQSICPSAGYSQWDYISSDSLKIVEGKESDVGSYKCQIPGVTQSADSVNVYFTKKLVFSPSTSPIYHHNTAAQIAFTCSYTKTGKPRISRLSSIVVN